MEGALNRITELETSMAQNRAQSGRASTPSDGKIRKEVDYNAYIASQTRGQLNPSAGIAGLMGMAAGMAAAAGSDLGPTGGGETEFLLPDSPHSNTPLLQAGEVRNITTITYERYEDAEDIIFVYVEVLLYTDSWLCLGSRTWPIHYLQIEGVKSKGDTQRWWC